jgi:transcription antitermination protein NusB
LNTDHPILFPDFDPDDVINTEVVHHTKATSERSVVRRIALQMLYELDSTEHQIGSVITTQLNYHNLSTKALKQLRTLVIGVRENSSELDNAIQHFAPEWPLNQVAVIDRNILRMAIYEFAIWEGTPEKVAIDEAVKLANVFGSDSSPRFINGVLGTAVSNRDFLSEKLSLKSDDTPDEEA